MDGVRELDVLGVRVEMPNNSPIVLLRERDGQRYVPIWIGAPEATAIAYAQQGVEPPRPLTHDLMASLIEALGRRLEVVHLTALQDGVFYSELRFDDGTTIVQSAAILLALSEEHPEAGLLPAIGAPDRRHALRWLMHIDAEIYPLI